MRWNLEECSMKACCKGFDFFLKIYKKDSRDHLRWLGMCASGLYNLNKAHVFIFFHFVPVSKISTLCQCEVMMVTGSLLVTSQQGCLGAWALWPPSEGVGCGGVGHG